RFLVPGGSRRGFWYRAGFLWVAGWWDHLRAFWRAVWTRRVTDRLVADKWKAQAASPWRAVRPHLVLASAAALAILWTCLRTDRRETVMGNLIFLVLILFSQGFLVWKLTRPAKTPAIVSQPAPEPHRLTM